MKRTRFQGLVNILRFNWHFFAIAGFAAVFAIAGVILLPAPWSVLVGVGLVLAVLTMMVSLIASHWVYDRSALYQFPWLQSINLPERPQVVNINAGFDEATAILMDLRPSAEVKVWDFYNEAAHTEVSIQRARRAYPPHPLTETVETRTLPAEDQSMDLVCLLMSAHEIRNREERRNFLREVHRILARDGVVVVTEHLRDIANGIAYTVGAFHFYSKATWLADFEAAGFRVRDEQKTTPFVSTFILEKS